MINILIPIAGDAKRFATQGYNVPKPLIPVAGVPMIVRAIGSLFAAVHEQVCLIFVVRDEHCIKYGLDSVLRDLFKDWSTQIVVIDRPTSGTLCSCLAARDVITPDDKLIIYTPDVCFNTNFDIIAGFNQSTYDGFLLTFKANSTDHSYVTVDENQLATRTAEKVVISNDALVGVYGYRSGRQFLKYADLAVQSGDVVNGEFYVAPMFNLLIADDAKIYVKRVEKMHVLGTPEDLVFYESHVAKYDAVRKFAVCCDHSGFELKRQLLNVLNSLNLEFTDFGAHSAKDSDHYDSLKPCADYLLTTTQTLGLAVCWTGQGFNIAANKVRGLRSVLVHDNYTAEMGRRHNAANFFCLASRTVNADQLRGIITSIVNNSFDGGRHSTRIRRITDDPTFID